MTKGTITLNCPCSWYTYEKEVDDDKGFVLLSSNKCPISNKHVENFSIDDRDQIDRIIEEFIGLAKFFKLLHPLDRKNYRLDLIRMDDKYCNYKEE